MRVPVLFALAALSTSGCAALGSLSRGQAPSVSDVTSGVAEAQEIKAKADECNAFAGKQVPYPEETSIGGAVALSLAKNTNGGVFVELSPELADQPAVDPARYADKKPAPAKGARTDLNRYVNLVGKALAAFSDRPAIDWTFAVLDSETPNAFSAPGGYVFITTGMLRTLDNEAQLAGVLGHEIGHVTGRHAIKSYQETKKLACYCAYFGEKMTGAGATAIRQATGPLGDQIQALPFADEVIRSVTGNAFSPNGLGGPFIKFLADKSAEVVMKVGFEKDAERDADATATRLMIFAGYDPGEFEKVLEKLPDGGGFFTPHPSNASRVEVVKATREEYEAFAAATKAPPLPAVVKKALAATPGS